MKNNLKITDVAVYPQGGIYSVIIIFSDGHRNVFDYSNMVGSDHAEFRKYIKPSKFKPLIVLNGTAIAFHKENLDMLLPLSDLYSKKDITIERLGIYGSELSVSQYASFAGLTRQGVMWQIKHGLLPKGVSARKIGNSWIISRT